MWYWLRWILTLSNISLDYARLAIDYFPITGILIIDDHKSSSLVITNSLKKNGRIAQVIKQHLRDLFVFKIYYST